MTRAEVYSLYHNVRREDGAIVGESTVEHPTIWNVNGANTGTAWLILNGKLKNFEFKTK